MNGRLARTVGLVSLVVSAASLFPAPHSPAQPLTKDSAASLHQEAITLYRRGQYEQAAKRYRELVAMQPDQAELYKDLMWVLWRAQRTQESAEVAAHITTRWPDDLEAWNLLGNAQLALDHPQEAIQAFEHSLRLDPEQFKVWRTVAQLYLGLRHYERVSQLAQQLLARYPNQLELYPLLARAQTFQGDFAQAAKSWAKAREFFPDNLSYHYQEASALYRSGQTKQALSSLQRLVAKHPDYQPAVDVLVDHAIVRRDFPAAIQLLERRMSHAGASDDAHCLKLARIYGQLERTEPYINTLDRCLQLNPMQGDALILKAEYLKNSGQLAKSLQLYQRYLELNPWSSRALIGMADLHHTRGRYTDALRLVERVRRLDPQDPYLLLTHARYLYAQGRIMESNRLLTDWLSENRGPVLLALVYHGLTTSTDDPLLASPVHLTTEVFEDHVRALRDAGFVPVTAEQVRAWYEGKAELPPRPVLITFDDARLDSFQYADPILARYGFKTTMFVPMVNVERNLPAYASWDQIKAYHNTGRWEIQSHGAEAAKYIVTDQQGRRGLFLVNRQWLPDEDRVETLEEWRERIDMDYRLSQDAIANALGTKPVAFAYPESNFGQEGIPTTQDAAPVNLELARRTFGSAYHQDLYGLNVRSEDPILLSRLEPRSTVTGNDLVRHTQHRDPFTLVRATLLRHAAWQGRIREARLWLDELQRSGAPDSLQLIEQARLHFAAGDPIHGRAMINQAVRGGGGSEVAQIAEALHRGDTRWVWAPSVSFQTDNRDRDHLVAEQRFGSWQLGSALWHIDHRSGFFKESGVGDVTAHGLGVGMTTTAGLFHQFGVQAMGHALDTDADTGAAATGSATWRARWTDRFSTSLKAGQALVETARALDADVRDRYGEVGAAWDDHGPWHVSWLGRAADLSDSNQRFSSVVEISRRLLELLPPARLVYRFTLDDTSALSPNYYSPQGLMLHQLGVHYQTLLWKGLELSVRYLPGYGNEQGSDPRFVQSLQIDTPFRWRDTLWLRPMLFFSRTPTFESNKVGVMMEFRF